MSFITKPTQDLQLLRIPLFRHTCVRWLEWVTHTLGTWYSPLMKKGRSTVFMIWKKNSRPMKGCWTNLWCHRSCVVGVVESFSSVRTYSVVFSAWLPTLRPCVTCRNPGSVLADEWPKPRSPAYFQRSTDIPNKQMRRNGCGRWSVYFPSHFNLAVASIIKLWLYCLMPAE